MRHGKKAVCRQPLVNSPPAVLKSALKPEAMSRTGPYAAAQLWKLDTISGRYIDLGALIAPFLGDPTELVPEEWLRVYRFINRFVPPLVLFRLRQARFHVFVEEVRGTGIQVLYRSRAHHDHDVQRAIPHNGTRNGYWHIDLVAEPRADWLDDWRARHGAFWPNVVLNNEVVTHPALENLNNRSRAMARAWVMQSSQHRERARRRELAIEAQRPIRWYMEGRARDEMGRPIEDSD